MVLGKPPALLKKILLKKLLKKLLDWRARRDYRAAVSTAKLVVAGFPCRFVLLLPPWMAAGRPGGTARAGGRNYGGCRGNLILPVRLRIPGFVRGRRKR
jgi:hypothetical protein